MTTTATQTLSTPAEVLRLLDAAQCVALDLETTALSPLNGRIRLLSLCDGKRAVVMDCFEHPIQQVLPAFKGKILVCHNALFDLGFLFRAGLTDLPETVCTYLLAQVLTAGEGDHGFPSLSLASCCHRWLDGMLLDKGNQKSDWSGSLTPEQIEYAARDVEVLPPLLKQLGEELDRAGLHRCADIEMRALRAFVWMSQSGVPFDADAWINLAHKAASEVKRLEERLDAAAPPKGEPGLFGHQERWNWASPDQVTEVFRSLGMPISTTADAQLALIDHPVASLLRQHREHAQLVKMYGGNWLSAATIRDGRVYPGWRQIGAASGRTSGNAPNMQQMPRNPAYRACVKAPPGKVLVKADYATLQMRIACKWAQDVALYNVFAGDGDPHTATARALLGKEDVTKADRQIAKSANFGLLFGMSAAGLRIYAKTTYGVNFTEEEATRHRARFFEVYPGLARWHAETKRKHVKETRCTSGRRRLLPVNAPDTWRLNSPVQGDESDGLKLSLALLWETRHKCPDAVPVLAVHDELVLECDADQAEQAKTWLTECMEDGMWPFLDPVPVRVDASIKQSWGD